MGCARLVEFSQAGSVVDAAHARSRKSDQYALWRFGDGVSLRQRVMTEPYACGGALTNCQMMLRRGLLSWSYMATVFGRDFS